MYNTPSDIVEYVKKLAAHKSETSKCKTLALAFLAGSYIALGGLLSVVVSGGIPGIAAENPGIQKLLMGACFPLGLMLCAIAGADLFTGNTAYFVPSLISRQLRVKDMLRNWFFVYFGNFAGALFVAFFLTYLTGLFATDPWLSSIRHLAECKTAHSFGVVFLKGVGANWLVALAMWLSYGAKDISGKILGIWFPVMAFVAMGFEHSIANMFFIPTAMFYGADVSVVNFLIDNLIPATLGNIVGGFFLVGMFYGKIYRTEK